MKNYRINNQIRDKEVRVISEEGKNLGVFPLAEAIKLAKDRNLDLIEFSSNVAPPVCKIYELGKYLYEQKKKEKQQRKKQKVGKIKEVRITPRISEHDLETKANLIKKFIKKGFRVKIGMLLRGREKSLLDFAGGKLEYLFKKIEEETEVKRDGRVRKSPRGMEVIISKK